MLGPHSERVIWTGDEDSLASWYCLTADQHLAAFGYRTPSGGLLFSASFPIHVAPKKSLNGNS